MNPRGSQRRPVSIKSGENLNDHDAHVIREYGPPQTIGDQAHEEEPERTSHQKQSRYDELHHPLSHDTHVRIVSSVAPLIVYDQVAHLAVADVRIAHAHGDQQQRCQRLEAGIDDGEVDGTATQARTCASTKIPRGCLDL